MQSSLIIKSHAEQGQSERYGCFLKAFTVVQLQLTRAHFRIDAYPA